MRTVVVRPIVKVPANIKPGVDVPATGKFFRFTFFRFKASYEYEGKCTLSATRQRWVGEFCLTVHNITFDVMRVSVPNHPVEDADSDYSIASVKERPKLGLYRFIVDDLNSCVEITSEYLNYQIELDRARILVKKL